MLTLDQFFSLKPGSKIFGKTGTEREVVQRDGKMLSLKKANQNKYKKNPVVWYSYDELRPYYSLTKPEIVNWKEKYAELEARVRALEIGDTQSSL